MKQPHGAIRIFGGMALHKYLEQKKTSVFRTIESEKEDYILNVNESDYVKYKAENAKIEPLVIHDDQVYASTSEQMIPADRFPTSFYVRAGKCYRKDVFKFHVPFTGDATLLKYIPSTWISWTMNVMVRHQEFSFDIINFSDDAQAIAKEKDSNIQHIMQQLGNVSREVESYNSNIEDQIRQVVEARKQRILKKSDVLASLGVPIKKSDNASPTFSIPSPQKRKKAFASRPEVAESGYTPEPCLDKSTYFDILKLIHDVGKEFERLPSLYAGKEEEHLRDHFLMMLEPNFEGSATGETFNKKGKTDILLRHEGSNVFIAECKFWRGQKVFLETISQLLGYLTWRDSKAAVIMFVPNKEFTTVLETAKQVVKEHPNYIEFVNSNDETWLNYTFHLDGDRNRQLSIAIMLYHTPR